MCGIAGVRSNNPVTANAVSAMVEELYHRGPDADGYYQDGPFSAGMRRLAINDVAGGQQPLFNADGSIALLYNGEIYNYPALRRELEAKGHQFRTHSDGEVICHLYEHCGEDLFERLDGMFAAALWIAPQRRLILARDLPGEKPLYYSRMRDGAIAFASEITALRKLPGIDLELNRQAIWDFPTFLWIPEPATVYRDIEALPRGHLLIADDNGTRVRPYRNIFNREPLENPDDDASVIAETRRVVEGAVKSRLLSDVPVGSFLSGGLDSSIVATIAARELDSIDTFSVGFEDLDDPQHGRADESAAAEATARRIGSHHHAIHVTASSFRNELDRFCRHGDQPFAVSSGLGILAVAKAAREHGIKVLLSGDGADECFGGYSWYVYFAARVATPSRVPEDIVSYQNFGQPIEERLAAIAALPNDARAWAWHYYAHEQEKSALFCADFRAGLTSSLRHFHGYRPEPWQPVDFIAQDRDFYFPNEMLRKVDRMAMAYSVEGRVPFAAPAVLSHAAKLGFGHMVSADGTLKRVLRRAFDDVLPREVIARPKHGFNVPIDHWLRGEWSDLVQHSFSSDSALRRAGLVTPGAGDVARAMLHDPRRLNGHTIFCMIMLNAWLERSEIGNHC